jgi:hypothetical protein
VTTKTQRKRLKEYEGIFDFKDNDENSSLADGIDYTKEENFAVKCFVDIKLEERREEYLTCCY